MTILMDKSHNTHTSLVATQHTEGIFGDLLMPINLALEQAGREPSRAPRAAPQVVGAASCLLRRSEI